MSIYNFNFPNQIDLRCRDGIMDKLKVWDPAKQEYVVVVPGGGGDDTPSTLPFYVKPEKLDFTTAGNALSSSLDQTNLLFADGKEVEAVNMSTLREQRRRLDQTDEKVYGVEDRIAAVDEKFITVEETLKTTGENIKNVEEKADAASTKINTVETRLNAVESKASIITRASNAFILKEPSSNLKLIANNGLIKVISHPGETIPAMGAGVHIYPNGSIIFHDGNVGERLTRDMVTRLFTFLTHIGAVSLDTKLTFFKPIAFNGILPTTSLVNQKMLVMNTSDRLLSYADIPTSTATTAPLTFTNGTNSSTIHDTEKFEVKFEEGDEKRSLSLRNDSIVFASSKADVSSEIVLNAEFFQTLVSKMTTPKYYQMADVTSMGNAPTLIKFDIKTGNAVNSDFAPYHLNMNPGSIAVIRMNEVLNNTWYGFSVNNLNARDHDSAYTLTGCAVNWRVLSIMDPGFHVATNVVRRPVAGVDTKLICFKIITPKNLTDYSPGTYNLTLQWIADDTVKMPYQ